MNYTIHPRIQKLGVKAIKSVATLHGKDVEGEEITALKALLELIEMHEKLENDLILIERRANRKGKLNIINQLETTVRSINVVQNQYLKLVDNV
ncbi:MAG: hypothetical protein ACI9N9_000073 [Enterobacterales bacterium]|jgi:hypothetical protein